MSKLSNIYILSTYANKTNLESYRHSTTHEFKITFPHETLKLELSEENSLIEDRYCLRMESCKFTLKGNDSKIHMLHHHPTGHPGKHLQFKLSNENNEVIRITLDPLNGEEYENCIKGFLYIVQYLIKFEQDENNIDQDLVAHFFDNNIIELEPYRQYLLSKIKIAHEQGNIEHESTGSLSSEDLLLLKKSGKLLPFLDW